jgi:secreted Zn-dependent insulinase-like peptidase
VAACHLGRYALSMGIPRDSRTGSMRSACESRVDLVTCVVIPHNLPLSNFRSTSICIRLNARILILRAFLETRSSKSELGYVDGNGLRVKDSSVGVLIVVTLLSRL